MRRFSIAGLMAVVLACGVAVAALRNASETWAGGMLLLTLGWLGAAVLGVTYRREAGRAGWFGFALFGGGYLALALGPWPTEQVRSQLPTTLLLDYVHGQVVGASRAQGIYNLLVQGQGTTNLTVATYALTAAGAGGPQPIPVTTLSGRTFRLLFAGAGNYEPFQRIGHCLFALLAGLVGTGIARWFHAGRRRAEAASRG